MVSASLVSLGGDGTEGSGARLMSCQIFGGEREGGNSANAIVYSANNGAVISQNSWGYIYKANITSYPSEPEGRYRLLHQVRRLRQGWESAAQLTYEGWGSHLRCG